MATEPGGERWIQNTGRRRLLQVPMSRDNLQSIRGSVAVCKGKQAEELSCSLS